MKRILTVLFFIIVAAGAYWLFLRKDDGKKTVAVAADAPIISKKHSDEFNDRVNAAVSAYLLMKDAFVDADSVAAMQEAGRFKGLVSEIPLAELDSDQAQISAAARQQVSDIKANVNPIENGETLAEMRRDFFMVSENLYPFLKTIGYEGEKLYWQNCPMAFGDNEEANWLSNTRQINNPYLGKKHPVYKSAMLHCGEVKDSIYAR